MNSVLFIDDDKKPEWYGLDSALIHVAKTFELALELMIKNKYEIIYLDHDLGTVKTDGSVLLNRYMSTPGSKAPQKVFCISWNPIGRERIRLVCKDWNIPCIFIRMDVDNCLHLI